MHTRPQVNSSVYTEARAEGLQPMPVIKFNDLTAIADEYHVEIWGASDGGDMYTSNLALIKDGKLTDDYIYGHSYTDEDFIKWTLAPLALGDYLRFSSCPEGSDGTC